MLLAAVQKYGKVVQMGTQQRSSPHTIEIVGKIHDGAIGKACFAKAWYSNVRKSIGTGTSAPVARGSGIGIYGRGRRRGARIATMCSRTNWHWFRIYGTGEALNNGHARS